MYSIILLIYVFCKYNPIVLYTNIAKKYYECNAHERLSNVTFRNEVHEHHCYCGSTFHRHGL